MHERNRLAMPNQQIVKSCNACGMGDVIVTERDGNTPPSIGCSNCAASYAHLQQEIGWIDALFRKDAALQLLQSQDASLELLDALMYLKGLAISAGRFYDAVRFEFMASILDIRNDEIDELDAAGWFADPTNVALNMRSSQAERDEIVCEHEDLQRLIDQAKARVQ